MCLLISIILQSALIHVNAIIYLTFMMSIQHQIVLTLLSGCTGGYLMDSTVISKCTMGFLKLQ